jgi:hypothetical protein
VQDDQDLAPAFTLGIQWFVLLNQVVYLVFRKIFICPVSFGHYVVSP